MRLLSGFAIGLLFGVGIVVAGMANPAKVLNFFDVFGTFDPSLGFVMAGALAVAMPGFHIVLRQRTALFGGPFLCPTTRRIDAALILGSATFGVGWGIAGFCPGGALPALGTGTPDVLIFVAAVAVGVLGARAAQTWLQPRRGSAATSHTM